MRAEELRRRREALHLTQADLGRALGAARNTVARWERGELPIRRPTLLAAALDQLEARSQPAVDVQRNARTHGRAPDLPAELTSFVGRERLLEDLTRRLRRAVPTCRLLTLTGSGGTGKTRVALRLASALGDQFEDGVWFVGLSSTSDARLVASTIARTMGVPNAGAGHAIKSLERYLSDRQVLLVLDSFEQVLGAAGQIAELLAASPRLQVVVTSRAALRVSGEQEVAVPPLALPGSKPASTAGPQDLAETDQCEAVRLFVERARAVRADFALATTTASAVAEICMRLDGLPLAIELAAARVRLLDAPAILARLERRLPFLIGGPHDLPARQQTLRDTIAWSYDLLDPPEQAFFRMVATFVGGCSIEAAQAVSLHKEDVLEAADSLAGKSLLGSVIARPGEIRLTILETTREFGLEQSASCDELERLQLGHAKYFLAMAEQAEAQLWGPAASVWLDRLERDHDNMRAALEWALAGGPGAREDIALKLAGALSRFWWTRSHFEEGQRWLVRALATPGRTAARMKALHGAGWLAHFQRDSATARELLKESLSIALDLHDQWTVAWVLHCLGRVAYFDGDHVRARTIGEQSLRIAESIGDQWLIAWALHLLGLAAHIATNYESADGFYERSLAIRRALGHHEAIGVLYQLMGISAHRQRNFPQARALYQEFLEIGRELGSPYHLGNVLSQFASLAAAQQQPERAVRLIGAASMVNETFRTRPIPLIEALFGEAVDQARQALGEEAFAQALAQGRAMSNEEAIAEALSTEVAGLAWSATTAPLQTLGQGRRHGEGTRLPRTRARHAHGGLHSGLTGRENEVAALVVNGLTNRQIAAELHVTERTVAAHVEHILNKLGFVSRTQIAAWAATNNPAVVLSAI